MNARRPNQSDLSANVKLIIRAAELDGLTIDDGNVIDLLIDNLPDNLPICDLRRSLIHAGFSERFPRAIRRQS